MKLRLFQSPPPCIDFCKVKGCVSVRNDADVSSLTPYQQQTAGALRSQTVLNSISYGEVISPAMQDGFFQAVKDYISTRNAASFNRILTERLKVIDQNLPVKTLMISMCIMEL